MHLQPNPFNVNFLKFNTLLLLLLFCSASHASILIYIRDDVLQNYERFLAGRSVHDVDEFTSEFVRRDVVDMVLAQQAIKLGGFNGLFEYASGRVNFRNTRLLESGMLLMSFDSYWMSDAEAMEDFIYVSKPVIRKGEYYAGIFASPKHPSIFNVNSVDELRQYTAASTPRWRTDWQTLDALSLRELIREDEWVSQAQMVSKMLVDFIMMPFHVSNSETYKLDNIELKPIPKVALLLNDSRHFVVSKKHPLGEEVFAALSAGLKQLRQNGRVERAYREAGFMIDMSAYRILNQTE